MSRPRLFLLWALCLFFTPILSLLMLIHVLAGSKDRAFSMAVSCDYLGNAAFGGTIGQTISCRVGNNLKHDKLWAKRAAFVIDLFFGSGHCLSNAST